MSPGIDLHAHSTYSDGDFSPDAIVSTAVERGLTHIALTDHYRTSKTHSVSDEELPGYISRMEFLRSENLGRIQVLLGLELDLLDIVRTGRGLPPEDCLRRLDFVLMEYAGDIPIKTVPLHHVLRLRSQLSIPCILAHTDLPAVFPNRTPSELINLLSSNRIYLELNESYCRLQEARPFYEYMLPYFDVIRSSKVLLSVGSDTHHDLTGLGAYQAESFLKLNRMDDRLFIPERNEPDPVSASGLSS